MTAIGTHRAKDRDHGRTIAAAVGAERRTLVPDLRDHLARHCAGATDETSERYRLPSTLARVRPDHAGKALPWRCADPQKPQNCHQV